jgi:predicted amidophosphoribosyltransferase
MAVAIVVVLSVVLGNLFILALLRGSSLSRPTCPRCAGHDTFVGASVVVCADCGAHFSMDPPEEPFRRAA